MQGYFPFSIHHHIFFFCIFIFIPIHLLVRHSLDVLTANETGNEAIQEEKVGFLEGRGGAMHLPFQHSFDMTRGFFLLLLLLLLFVFP